METVQGNEQFERTILQLKIFFAVLVIIATGAFVWALISPASALNITLADSTLSGNHSIDVMAANGSLLATGYSGDTVDINISDAANDTIIIHYLPPAVTGGARFVDRLANVFDTPTTMLDSIKGIVDAYMVEMVVGLVVLLAAVVLFGRR